MYTVNVRLVLHLGRSSGLARASCLVIVIRLCVKGRLLLPQAWSSGWEELEGMRIDLSLSSTQNFHGLVVMVLIKPYLSRIDSCSNVHRSSVEQHSL